MLTYLPGSWFKCQFLLLKEMGGRVEIKDKERSSGSAIVALSYKAGSVKPEVIVSKD